MNKATRSRLPSYLDPRGPVFRTAALGLVLIIGVAALWALSTLLAQVAVVLIPLLVALLLAALFVPLVEASTRRGVPRGLAATAVLILGTALVVALLVFVTRAIVTGLPDLQQQLRDSYAQLRDWLTGTLGVSGGQIDSLLTEAQNWVGRHQQELASGAWGAFATAGSVLTGVVLVLFILIVFVYDGPRIWRFLLTPLTGRTKDTTDRVGRRIFHDLGAYVRATAAIAMIDAIGIGLGLLVMGVPLVLPLACLVFLGGFLPLVGAFVSGMLAVLVALVSQGPVVALIVIAIVIAVQQLEGNVFQPLLMSNAVKLHPLAVVLAIAIGVDQAGIVGAVLAVPLLAALRAATSTLLHQRANTTPIPESTSGHNDDDAASSDR